MESLCLSLGIEKLYAHLRLVVRVGLGRHTAVVELTVPTALTQYLQVIALLATGRVIVLTCTATFCD